MRTPDIDIVTFGYKRDPSEADIHVAVELLRGLHGVPDLPTSAWHFQYRGDGSFQAPRPFFEMCQIQQERLGIPEDSWLVEYHSQAVYPLECPPLSEIPF